MRVLSSILENIDKEKEYVVRIGCANCGNQSPVAIPKGTTILEACRGVKCSNCGCKSMKKISE